MKPLHNRREFLKTGTAALVGAGVLPVFSIASSADRLIPLGAARIDITPDYPIRLNGYASRRTESEGISERIYARALAIGGSDTPASVLISVENRGVQAHIVESVYERLRLQAGLRREHFAVSSTHTHAGPALNVLPLGLQMQHLPPDQQERIDRYTLELTGHLEAVALQALQNRRPARLSHAQGTASFAANRRVIENGRWTGFGVNPDGPVDHDLPVLFAHGEDGTLMAVLFSYACHCTTLTAGFNQIHGDWAGDAMRRIEARHPDAVALGIIGCAGDSNPVRRDRGLEDVAVYGREIADEVDRLLRTARREIAAAPSGVTRLIQLPFEPLPSVGQWEERTRLDGLAGFHARYNLQRIRLGEELPESLPYLIQAWHFGNEFSMVFLPGEVVVDYALRLKKEMSGRRLWVNAYTNDGPGYIPSRRILQEGGYEVQEAVWNYNFPTQLAPETEERLIGSVLEMMQAPRSPR